MKSAILPLTIALFLGTSACGGDDEPEPSSGSGGGGGVGAVGGAGGGQTGGTGAVGGTAGGSTGGGGAGGSATGGSAGAAGTGGAGGDAGQGGAGTGGMGGVSGCANPESEPNDSSSSAQGLADIDSRDDTGCVVQGALNGVGDADWFTLHATDHILGAVDPTLVFASSTSGQVELCIYYACDQGTPDVTCIGNATPDTLGSAAGCCANEPGLFTLLNCEGTMGDDATMTFKVSGASNPGSHDYLLAYHY